jgi:hypothetical protein
MMKFTSKVTKVVLVLCVLGGVAIASVVVDRYMTKDKDSSGFDVFLARPAIAQEAGGSFLDQEAGISAYTNLGQKVDLSKIRAVLKTVEAETDTYVIGSISVPKYEGYPREDVHCFAHKDGWVVTYYRNTETTAKIISWRDWSGKITGTKLDMGLTVACDALDQKAPYVRYYHFKYPDAVKLMVIVKTKTNQSRIMIPSSFAIYERSWSQFYTYDYGYSGNGSYIKIDDVVVSNERAKDGECGANGLINPTQLKPDVFHNVVVIDDYGAIVLLYRES